MLYNVIVTQNARTKITHCTSARQAQAELQRWLDAGVTDARAVTHEGTVLSVDRLEQIGRIEALESRSGGAVAA